MNGRNGWGRSATATGVRQAFLREFPADGPKVLWRTPIAGGYAGPSVVGSRVFVTDYVTTGDQTPSPDKRNELEGTERVLCLDADNGKLLWKHEYDCSYNISYPAGPRCTPTVDGDRVYTLGAEGDLRCLEVADGKLVWSKSFPRDFGAKTPIWGFAGHPLVDGDRLICIVGGPDALAVAFDKQTGEVIWKALDAEETGYSSPTNHRSRRSAAIVGLAWDRLELLESGNGRDLLVRAAGSQLWDVDCDAADGRSPSLRGRNCQ